MTTMKPTELRLHKHVANQQTFYTIDKLWHGVGNISFGQRRFMTLRDATDWATREWHGVPLTIAMGA